jgi:HPt (histidine-containing phosphotransfer) domain-containing protein
MKSTRVDHRVRESDPAEGSKNSESRNTESKIVESKIVEAKMVRSKINVLVPQTVPTPISSVKVSWDKTEALERMGGDQDLLRELCEIFLEESPKLLQRLCEALAESNANAVMRAAHSLKGELGYLGAAAALQAARALEDMGRDQNLSRAPEMLVLLERKLADLHVAMKDSAGAMQ